ncbi:MAG: hypothetical protein IJJ26_12280, partial [Victivallales bacterium]|nr:hypothetical protein [Victivallales bacterium]
MRFRVPWGTGREVVFLLQEKSSGRAIEIRLDEKGWLAREFLSGGRYADLPGGQAYALPKLEGMQEVLFKLRENEWTFYVGGHLCGELAAPFAFPGTVHWPSRPGVKLLGRMSFLATPRPSFKTDFMIEPGAPNELYPWTIQTGLWSLHTAQQQAVARPETDQQRAKEAPLTADKSPNFYSLTGSGKNTDSVITTGYDFYDNYALTCSLQLNKGEAGIVFAHRDAPVPPVAEGQEPQPPDPAKASFWALTLVMDTPDEHTREIRLWKQEDGKRTLLARAKTPLFLNQWYLPGIRMYGNELVCELDHAELFRVKGPLPTGGKIGMYAKTPEAVRFDDVTLVPVTSFDLANAAGLRFNTLFGQRDFLVKGGERQGVPAPDGLMLFPLADNATGALSLTAHRASTQRPRTISFGRAHNRNMMFSMHVQRPENATGTFGILAGLPAPNAPHYLFQISREGEADLCQLLKCTPNQNEVLDSYRIPGKCTDADLLLDATDPGNLRCYFNGLMVHHAELDAPLVGTMGITTTDSTLSFHTLSLASERHRILELEQKNPIFQHDSFMRHWASPEGQWINGGKDILWHKGDYFGDFTIRLPIVPGSELHLAVPDDTTEGVAIVKPSDNKLELFVRVPGAKEPLHKEAPLAAIDKKPVTEQFFTVHHEGTWLWLDVEGKTVIRQRLPFRLKSFGTRVLTRKMNLRHMANSKVTRANVIDEYYNESPHDWLVNGGDWQIINRFQCTPSWSHMIDECPNTLGATWRKQLFEGDMTIEFYAGTRHNWYDKAGNLNCTIMADARSASRGYTVTCTQWDQNLSQNWTTLFRNGVPLKRTDAYLVPRRRKGMYRRILNPLVSQGRPYHGAWFYCKLRKIGDKLEYYFDDERIFSTKDPQMIQRGLAGIWTFDHSMTLAQIKITFDKVEPLPVPVTLLPLEEKPAPTPNYSSRPNATAFGFPLDMLSKFRWQCNDTVAQSTLESARDSQGHDILIFRNRLGAGDMKFSSNGAWTTGGEKVAGWAFDVKRTDSAQFNFFYQIQGIKSKSTRHFFHRLTGDDFSRGNWQMTGETAVPASPSMDNLEDGWTPVHAWFPTADRKAEMVHFTGFGIEQLDFLASGIGGNLPGCAYAVRDLRPVFQSRPVLRPEKDTQISINGAPPTSDPKSIDDALAAIQPQNNLARADILLTRGQESARHTLEWVVNPQTPQFQLEWDPQELDCIRCSDIGNVPDVRFDNIVLNIEKTRVTPVQEGKHFLFYLPRTPAMASILAKGKFDVFLRIGDFSQTFPFDAKDKSRQNGPPALFSLNGITPFLNNFENGFVAPFRFTGGNRNLLRYSDSERGRFLHVQNRANGHRLQNEYTAKLSMAQFPVAQMRYRGDDMAHVSLSLRGPQFLELSPSDIDSNPIRHSRQFILDEKWHSWIGIVTDACTDTPFSTERFSLDRCRIASRGQPDQTGRYSWLDLDDFSFGPAIHTPEQLNCQPEYFDLDGVSFLQWAILPGVTPYEEIKPEQQKAIVWTTATPGHKITPSFPPNLPDGIAHFLLRATDIPGKTSPVTDIPFLLDRQPITATSVYEPDASPFRNKT